MEKVIWTVYSKPDGRCPHCENTKKFFKTKGIPINITIVEDKDKASTFTELKDKIGDHKTFPIIFMGDKFIGGYSKLQEYIKENPDLFTEQNTTDNMKIIRYLASMFDDICIVLPEHKDENTSIPEQYWTSLRTCANSRRFTIFPFQILCGDKYNLNFMIYDSVKKTLERFDPHKLRNSCSENTLKEIDEQIVEMFRTKMGDFFIEKYLTPSHNCNYDEHSDEDLCVYIYARERLSNPDINREEIDITNLENDFIEDYDSFNY